MATSEMAGFGPVTGAWEVAGFNMAASTRKQRGFELAECARGDIQSRNKIGFWCHYSTDGSVMMIGGGGYRCAYADHGMGITETDRASFVEMGDGNVGNAEYDFGHNAYAGNPQISSAYSLNLWIR